VISTVFSKSNIAVEWCASAGVSAAPKAASAAIVRIA
jgi:hypothetical protein